MNGSYRLSALLGVWLVTLGGPGALAQREDPRWAHEVFMRVPSAGEFVLPSAAAPGEPALAVWKYTFNQPASAWTERWYSDTQWSAGQAGFEQWGLTDPLDVSRTTWPADKPQLWLKRSFVLTQDDLERNELALWGRWDDTMEVFINGVEASTQNSWTPMYRWASISRDAQAELVAGQNTIAVHMTDYGGGRYFDLALVRNPLKELPVTGWDRARGAWRFQEAAREYFQDRLIPGAAFAVMKDDRVVSYWSYGYLDKYLTIPLPPENVFRIASLDKPVSFAALRTLITDGYVEPTTGTPLTLDTKVFPLLGALGYTPPPGVTPDPRIGQITARMLLEHTSGIGYGASAAVTGAAFGLSENDVMPVHVARWLHGAPMIDDPGNAFHYSNEGVTLVRFMVNRFGGPIESYLRNRVNAGLNAPDFYIAAERLQSRRPNEPWYQTLEAPFARWISFECSLALAASAESYVNFLKGYHLWTGEALLNPVTGAYEPPDNGGSRYYGAYNGTRTVAVQRRWDRVSLAIFVNCNEDVGELANDMEWIADSMSPEEWLCVADFNQDGFLDPLDYNAFINAFEAGDMTADFNLDGFLDPLDYNAFINAFEAGC